VEDCVRARLTAPLGMGEARVDALSVKVPV
jgi:hypothetical protein